MSHDFFRMHHEVYDDAPRNDTRDLVGVVLIFLLVVGVLTG